MTSPSPVDSPTPLVSNEELPQPQSSISLAPGGRRAPPQRWATYTVEQLLLGLIDAQNQGLQSDNGFKEKAWRTCSDRLQREYRKVFSPRQCKNKHRTLKAFYNEWLAHCEVSGWGWNDEAGVPVTDEAVMDDYFKRYPNRTAFRNTPPLYLDLQQRVFGSGGAPKTYTLSSRQAIGAIGSDSDSEFTGLPDIPAPSMKATAYKGNIARSESVTARHLTSTTSDSHRDRLNQLTRGPDSHGRPSKSKEPSLSDIAAAFRALSEQLDALIEVIKLPKKSPIEDAIHTLSQRSGELNLTEDDRHKLIQVFLKDEGKTRVFNALQRHPIELSRWIQRHLEV